MTRRLSILEFIVPTVLAIAFAIVLSVGAVNLTDAYLGPVEKSAVHRSIATLLIADCRLCGMRA